MDIRDYKKYKWERAGGEEYMKVVHYERLKAANRNIFPKEAKITKPKRNFAIRPI